MATSTGARRRTEYMPLDEISPAATNPKDHDPELIRASIARFGLIEWPTMDERTGRLIHGHGRLDDLQAARALGLDAPDGVLVKRDGTWTVPVNRGWSSIDDDEAEAAAVALNQATIAGGWKNDQLIDVLERLRASRGDDGLVGTGFTPLDLSGLITQRRRDEKKAERNNTDELDVDAELARARNRKAIAKVGDVWQCGRHRIICGDSTDPAVLTELLDGEMLDFVFTSPPYNVGVDYNDVADREGDDDKTFDDTGEWEPYADMLRSIVAAFMPHLRDGRVVGWNIGVSKQTRPFWHALMLEESGLEFYRQLVWQKVGVVVPCWNKTVRMQQVRRFYPNYQHELVYLFSKGDLDREGGDAHVDERFANDVFVVNQTSAARTLDNDPLAKLTGAKSNLDVRARKEHPAVFPLDVVQPFVGMLCDPDEIVLDPFGGSGTTMIAAENTGRRGYLVELLPNYVDVACKRYQRHTGEKPVRVRDGKAINFDR